jgi:hypothetical protein
VGTKTAAQRQRRVADTLAWRARQKRGAAVYPIEVGGRIFDLLVRFGGLRPDQDSNKQAVADALVARDQAGAKPSMTLRIRFPC